MTETWPDHYTAYEIDVARRFRNDVREHQLTVLHDNGLYRHLRVMRPGHSAYYFDVISWPGSLAIRGDVDSGYVFSRTRDMFQFFRSGKAYINPKYWSEKLDPTVRDSLTGYSKDALMSVLRENITYYRREIFRDQLDRWRRSTRDGHDRTGAFYRLDSGPAEKPITPRAIWEKVRDADEWGRLETMEGARELLDELESDGVLSDVWEMGSQLKEWEWQYLWSCHAIVHAITLYDRRSRARRLADHLSILGRRIAQPFRDRVAERRSKRSYRKWAEARKQTEAKAKVAATA